MSEERLKTILNLLGKAEAGRALEETRVFFGESSTTPGEKAALLAKALNHAYTHLAPAGVHAFLNGSEALSPKLAEMLTQFLAARMAKTTLWRETLADLRRERLARELRGAVRENDLRSALARVAAMAAMAKQDQGVDSLIGYLAAALGTLDHDQDKVLKLLKAIDSSPSNYGLTPEQSKLLADARERQFSQLSAMGLEGREREFNRALLQAVVELRNSLSLESPVGEPTEEETARLTEDLSALLRAVVLVGAEDAWIDATMVLVEVAPRDPRAVGPAAQGEERLFLGLNPRQKLRCVRALRRLGDLPRLRSMYLHFLGSKEALPYRIFAVEVMGGFGHPDFAPHVLDLYRGKKLSDPRYSCVDALGRLGHQGATDALMDRFRQLVRSKPFDPPKRREAEAISTALARIARNPRVPPRDRNDIVSQVVKALPIDDAQMGLRTALDFFSFRPEDLDEGLIAWAAERVAQSLWGQDQRPEFARSDEGSRAGLGFRQAMADLAFQLGPRALRPFLRAIEPNFGRCSGAFVAAAEILEKIGDESAFPALQRMALSAWTASDSPGSKYFQETYFDPADQTSKPMTRDRIIHSLLYSAMKIGGTRGMAFILDTAKKVQSKQLEAPGSATASFLMTQLMEHGGNAPLEAASDQARPPARDPESIGAMVDSDNPLSGAHMVELLEAIKPKLFGAKLFRSKQILAIQEVARRQRPETIGSLANLLGGKDPMVQSAVTTALENFAAPGAPRAAVEQLGETLVELLGSDKEEERRSAGEILRRLNPAREPFRKMIVNRFEAGAQGVLRAELSGLIRQYNLTEPPGESGRGDIFSSSPMQISAGQGASAGPPGASRDEIPAAQKSLDAKRVYFAARKRWIEGGKKGPPPEAPAE